MSQPVSSNVVCRADVYELSVLRKDTVYGNAVLFVEWLPNFRLAPQDEQNSEPAVSAEPQLPLRSGSGGTYPPALPAMCSSIIFHASSVILYCQ